MPAAKRSQRKLQPKATKREIHVSTNDFPSETSVESVLPFLLLNPLEKAGYLKVLAVAFGAAELDELFGAFAAAFAYKVLPAPLKGWQRSTATQQAAAAFAGSTGAVPSQDIHQLASHSREFTSALSSQLASELLQDAVGRNSLFLRKMDSEEAPIYLGDAKGNFPIALLSSSGDIRQLLMQWEAPTLIVDSSLSDPDFLGELGEGGIQFLIAGLPTRGENLRVIKNKSGDPFSTNDYGTSSKKLVRMAEQLRDCQQATEQFWIEIADRRLAAPLAKTGDFENALTLAVGVAMAQLAWDLWQDQEETHPLLTLRRFGDFSGTVRFTSKNVHVTVPLGKRAWDLAAHGYLNEIRNVPWLGNRSLTFSQG